MVGLGVMGRNLVLNLAGHGCAVAGYDQDQAKVEALRQESKERGAVGVGSFEGLIFPNLALCLKPVLSCLANAAASLLVEFIGSLGDLRRHLDRFLANRGAAVGSKIRYASSFTRSLKSAHISAYPHTNPAQPQPRGVMNSP